MNKLTSFKVATLASLLASTAVIAQEELPTNATMEIANVFTLAQTTPLSFGTVRASQDVTADTTGDEVIVGAGIKVNADGSASQELTSSLTQGTTGDAALESSLTIILPGSPATYTISGAAANTPLQILQEYTGGDAIAVDNGEVDDQDFVLSIAYTDMYITSGPNANNVYTSATPNLTTDGAGGLTFAVGGTLRINPDADASFAEGTYSGDYRMIVSY